MKTDTQQQTKHTAGPWTVENDNRDDCMMTIRSSGAGRLGVAYCGKDDARLIAAAPELLDALRNAGNVLAALATGQLKTVDRNSPALAQIRAAIAKAEGRA